MMHHSISIATSGRALYPITALIAQRVLDSGIQLGLCHLFIKHTSASLLISENTDPLVLEDLEMFFSRLVADGASWMKHQDEGPDDMPSHIRSVLTQTHLTIPIVQRKLDLGTWQGVFLWEHRFAHHHRNITVILQGS